jgi:hypothetical protein
LFLHRAGDAIENLDGYKYLLAPPISVLLDQQIVETQQEQSISDVTRKKKSYIEQSLFAISCSVDKRTPLTLFPFHVTIKLDSITSTPQRKSCTSLLFTLPKTNKHTQEHNVTDIVQNINGNATSRPLKKQRCREIQDDISRSVLCAEMVDVMVEVTRFAEIIVSTLEGALDNEDIEMLE